MSYPKYCLGCHRNPENFAHRFGVAGDKGGKADFQRRDNAAFEEVCADGGDVPDAQHRNDCSWRFFEQSANERQQSMAETLLFFSFTYVEGCC